MSHPLKEISDKLERSLRLLDEATPAGPLGEEHRPTQPGGTMKTTKTRTRTITLTDRPPVTIHEDLWPVIAVASYHDWEGEHDFQSSRHWKGFVRVRQNADGRTIVYAKCWHESAWRKERGYEQYAGELLPADCDSQAIVGAIKRVHASIDIVDDAHLDSWRLLSEECIADLPADELD